MTPRLTEVFVIKEGPVEVLKKAGKVNSSQLPPDIAKGVEVAENSDGQHLPYKGKPPEGTTFFLQDPKEYSSGPMLCMNIGKENFTWQVFEGGRADDEGDYDITDDDGNVTSTGNAAGEKGPDIRPSSGVWLPLGESEVEQWMKSKLARKHLRVV